MPSFLALYMGSDAASARGAPSPDEIAKGMAAWGKWMADHAGVVVDAGGPLGKTKAASRGGLADTSNQVTGYVIVRADSHDEAVKLFVNHPHFAIFPGDRVEVMPVMPIPTGP